MKEKERYEQELAMRKKEQELMEAQTKAIEQSAWEQRWASQELQNEIAKQASMQQTLIQQQMAQNDKLYRQRDNFGFQMDYNLKELQNLQRQDMTYYR